MSGAHLENPQTVNESCSNDNAMCPSLIVFLQEVWNRAIVERRKYVTIVPLPDWKPDSLQKYGKRLLASPLLASSTASIR